MDQLTLGIGTRLQHTQYGPGVIVGVRYATYQISELRSQHCWDLVRNLRCARLSTMASKRSTRTTLTSMRSSRKTSLKKSKLILKPKRRSSKFCASGMGSPRSFRSAKNGEAERLFYRPAISQLSQKRFPSTPSFTRS
jgi:hypothetical protein